MSSYLRKRFYEKILKWICIGFGIFLVALTGGYLIYIYSYFLSSKDIYNLQNLQVKTTLYYTKTRNINATENFLKTNLKLLNFKYLRPLSIEKIERKNIEGFIVTFLTKDKKFEKFFLNKFSIPNAYPYCYEDKGKIKCIIFEVQKEKR